MLTQFNASPHIEKTFSANSCCFDKSGKVVAVACEDNTIRIFDLDANEEVKKLDEPKDIVHDVKFDYNSSTLVSCGAD